MADNEQYHLSKPAEWIDKVIAGAVIGTEPMPNLSANFKAQFRENIGAADATAKWQPLGFFDTVEELIATITTPAPGDAYAVGVEEPFNIWVWDGVNQRWRNGGNLKGMDGKDGEDGSDANVTAENIIAALGYTPADAENVGVPDGSIDTAQLANGAVTQEKLAEDVELGVTITKLWQNLDPSSEFPEQSLSLDFAEGDFAVVFFWAGTDAQGGATLIVPVGRSARALIPYGNNLAKRLATANVGEITFGDAQQGISTWETNNKRAIPVLVYRMRGAS